jgi:hypothetical protein
MAVEETSNAVLVAVAWADPYRIAQRTHATNATDDTNAIQFYSKPELCPVRRTEMSGGVSEGHRRCI